MYKNRETLLIFSTEFHGVVKCKMDAEITELYVKTIIEQTVPTKQQTKLSSEILLSTIL